jgi:protocatechuate 3,4-dioxygenase beta subunit
MKSSQSVHCTRRAILRAWLALPAAYVLAACTGQSAATPTPEPTTSAGATGTTPSPSQTTQATAPSDAATATAPRATSVGSIPTTPPANTPTATQATQAAALTPTPECGDDDDDPTPAQTEGPYYTPNTPERTSLLEADMTGTTLVLTGSVLTTGCAPVARALIDFWQADAEGQYDNVGFRLRGHQFTDDQGRYRLETVVPGLYPGRTRHIHVKVQAPNQPVLTTQLYFPGETRNASDNIYREELLMAVRDAADGQEADFDFVLEIG